MFALGKQEKPGSNKLADKISAHPLITAVILSSLVFLAAIIFCDPKYETNDDFWMDAVLSGALTGQYDPHLLFSNILLGYMLKGLYTLIPAVSFYFVMLEAAGLLSMIITVWLILRHNKAGIGLLASFILVACFSNDLFILVQFTKTAAAVMTAGSLLFLEGITDPGLKHRKAAAAAGGLVFLFGSMIRLECIYSIILFLFIMFVSLIRKGTFKDTAIRFVLCIVLICTAFGLQLVNNVIWKADPAYTQFIELNSYRVPVSDVKHPEYEKYGPALEKLGIDKTDYVMLDTWNFTDLDVFTPEKLSSLSGIFKDYNSPSSADISRTVNSFIGKTYWFYAATLGLVLISLLYAISSKKSLFVIISSILGCAAILLLFSYLYRTVYRVEYGVFFAAFASIAVSIGKEPRKISISREIYSFAVVAGIITLMIYQAGTYIPDNSYKTLDDAKYFEHIYEVFGCDGYVFPKYRVTVSARRYHEKILRRMENSTGDFYLFDPLTFGLINYDYKPWLRMEKGYFADNFYTLGGTLMMQYPGESYVYEHNGIDPVNPYRSLVKDNIYVIDNLYYNEKLAYIRKHYYPNAQMKLVGEESRCKIWKFYIPE